jgi:hypothetical protein
MLLGSEVLPWIAALAGIVGLAAAGDYVRRALLERMWQKSGAGAHHDDLCETIFPT